MIPVTDERLINAKILVVDDIELNRKMLTHSLNANGYRNITVAHDGSQALTLTRELRPDLVILDLMMPTMDGFAYCQAVRQDPSFDNMPIIVQTVLEQINDKMKAFELGASDYICKPIDPGEISARTYVHLSRKLLMQDLSDYKARITLELEAAKKMQCRLMPTTQQIQMCERVFNMKIANYFETSSHLGGDSWGMRPLSDNRLAIWMFDFSGHGIAAAMNVFRLHTIMQEFIHTGGEPGNYLSTLNRHLYPLLERNEFCTMFYGIIDTDANCLLYASAAIPSPILFSKTEPKPIMLTGRGFPLGIIPSATYDTKYVPFVSGDLLLYFSDCLVETRNISGQFIGDEQIAAAIMELLEKSPQNPAIQAIEKLRDLFSSHNSDPINDDMTINAYWRC
jgi:sigma-B regulation protein RsbU (phosphoserine phosphatase)